MLCTKLCHPSRSRVAEQVWANTRVAKHEVSLTVAGQVEGLGARDAGSKTRSSICGQLNHERLVRHSVGLLPCGVYILS